MKNNSIKLISQNALSLSIGQGLSFVLNFFSIAIGARYLGVSNFGTFSSLLAISMILSKIIDFGFTPIVFRETAKNRQLDLLNNAILLRVISFFCMAIIYNIITYYLNFPVIEIVLSNLLIFNIILSSKFCNIRELLEIPFKSELQMHYPMLFNVIDNLILLILVFLMPFVHGGIFYFTFAYFISNLPGFIGMIYMLRQKYNFHINLNLLKSKWLIWESLPLYGVVVFTIIFQQVDYLMIRYLDSAYSVGIFSAASRLTMPLYIIPAAVTFSILPIIIKNILNNDNYNFKIYRFVYKLLFLISFIFAILISFKVDGIVLFIFGKEYLSSALSTTLLAWTQIFMFHSYFTVELLIAHNNQKYSFQYSLVLVLTNLFLNFLLIPRYSYVGASISKLLACFLGFVFLVGVLKKLKINVGIDNVKFALWIIFNIVFLFCVSFFSLFVFMIISLIGILLITFLSRYFDDSEIILIFKMLHRENLGNIIIAKYGNSIQKQ